MPLHKRLLVFTILLAVTYPVVWIAWQPASGVYRALLTEGLGIVYSGRRQPFEFERGAEEIVFRVRGVPSLEAFLSAEGIDGNTSFLLTLLLVTPGIRLPNRFQRLTLGLALLYLAHAAFLITKVEVTLIAANHELARAAGLWSVVDDFFEISGRALFPVLIWLALALPYMLGRVDEAPPNLEGVGRNAPCPCGSGRKFKRCCGS